MNKKPFMKTRNNGTKMDKNSKKTLKHLQKKQRKLVNKLDCEIEKSIQAICVICEMALQLLEMNLFQRSICRCDTLDKLVAFVKIMQ
jgi:hypothetical protein